MTSVATAPLVLAEQRASTRTRLAAAWTAFSLMYIYVDVLGLYKPGVIDELRGGTIFGFDVTQEFLASAFTMVAIPFVMVLLTTVLGARVVRITNMVIAALYVPISIFNAAGETWYGYYGLTICLEVAILVWIFTQARTWPREG